MNSFYTALFQANLLYDVELTDEQFEEIGLIAWNMIGNKRTRLYRFTANLDCNNLTVELPCNADIVEAVTICMEDWQYTDNFYNEGKPDSAWVEHYIEGRKMFKDPLYISGRYAKFTQVGNTLYFDKDYHTVNILYKGVILDENGLPELTEKETNAIAAYCAFVQKYKEALKTNNSNIMQLALQLKRDALFKIDAARTPEYLNQNEANEILDVKTSWNRKIFNKSFKALK